MAFIPKSLFPNVPQLPGVPQLRRSLQFPAAPPPIAAGVIAVGRLAQAFTPKFLQAFFPKSVWGIFEEDEVTEDDTSADGIPVLLVKNGSIEPVVQPDSIIKFEYSQEFDVASAPVEQGGFVSYNKVNNPFEVTLRMTKTGTKSQRSEFLKQIDTVLNSLKLYKILTPEKTYLSCNMRGARLVREGTRGAYFFAEVDVSFIEIRTTQAQYSITAVSTQKARTASAKPSKNQGSVSGTAVTATPTVPGTLQ